MNTDLATTPKVASDTVAALTTDLLMLWTDPAVKISAPEHMLQLCEKAEQAIATGMCGHLIAKWQTAASKKEVASLAEDLTNSWLQYGNADKRTFIRHLAADVFDRAASVPVLLAAWKKLRGTRDMPPSIAEVLRTIDAEADLAAARVDLLRKLPERAKVARAALERGTRPAPLPAPTAGEGSGAPSGAQFGAENG
ncbi:MAG: hypothetical protein GC190_19170 [Alphaproteobacteria bacterium]|nr:hypothetical protein [Alphaproteobacteria bacterium]